MDSSLYSVDTLKALRGKGTYTLLILVSMEKSIAIGRIGAYEFSAGYYTYTGSAFGRGALSLGSRILRHLQGDKRKRWHIDYLLSGGNASVIAVVAADTDRKMECEINRSIRDEMRASVPIRGFGSSDCVEKCGSHLLYLGEDKEILKDIARIYTEKTGKEPYILRFR